MKKPDVIVVHPTHVDFPGFRYQLRKYRNLFNQVLIVMYRNSLLCDVTNFITTDMKQDKVTVLPALPHLSGDWRDHCIKRALLLLESDHILFLEQDFIIKNESMLSHILSDNECDVVGFLVPGDSRSRLHPAFLLIKKEILQLTSLNFAVKSPTTNSMKSGEDYWDHFGQIIRDIEDVYKIPYKCLDTDFSYQTPVDWEHLASLTHNYTLLANGVLVTFRPERFVKYNKWILSLPINQCPSFLPIIKRATLL